MLRERPEGEGGMNETNYAAHGDIYLSRVLHVCQDSCGGIFQRKKENLNLMNFLRQQGPLEVIERCFWFVEGWLLAHDNFLDELIFALRLNKPQQRQVCSEHLQAALNVCNRLFLFKRIDENRELLCFLMDEAPTVVEGCSGPIEGLDRFYCDLQFALELQNSYVFSGQMFPRPWPCWRELK